jgi:CSLREA domain-containing protein
MNRGGSPRKAISSATVAVIQALETRRLLTAFVVDTLSDNTDPSDNLTTLREAITAANDSQGTADSISFAPALTGSIDLASGELDITDSLAITGPGARVVTINGNNGGRIFTTSSDLDISISGLTLTGGVGIASDGGGAILNHGNLTLANCTLSNNRTLDGDTSFDLIGNPGGDGGAIYNRGTLTIHGCTFVNNTAGNGSNGIDQFDFGGDGGDGGNGGAIFNNENATLSIDNSTFVGNTAGKGGNGGNSLFGSFGDGGFGGNGGSGGAIANLGTATLVNVTLTDNDTGNGGLGGDPGGRFGFQGDGGGLFTDDQTSFKIANTLSANNDAGGESPDAFGVCTSLGHNLIAIADFSSGWVASDIIGTSFTPIDAKLDTLGNNGGQTDTIKLLDGSPAIDMGDAAQAAISSTDQRGQPRVSGAAPDIGAFEVQVTTRLPGDANHDNKVDFNDLVALAQNYNMTGGKTWEQGDFTGDGNVDFNDLVLLAQNYNTGTAASAPMPSLASVLPASKKKVVKPAAGKQLLTTPPFSVKKIEKPASPPTRAPK